nr:PREDICTED: caldesmon-like [Bemisia tabaci]
MHLLFFQVFVAGLTLIGRASAAAVPEPESAPTGFVSIPARHGDPSLSPERITLETASASTGPRKKATSLKKKKWPKKLFWVKGSSPKPASTTTTPTPDSQRFAYLEGIRSALERKNVGLRPHEYLDAMRSELQAKRVEEAVRLSLFEYLLALFSPPPPPIVTAKPPVEVEEEEEEGSEYLDEIGMDAEDEYYDADEEWIKEVMETSNDFDGDLTDGNTTDSTKEPERKPEETEPGETEASDDKPADRKPDDAKPAGDKAASLKPADAKPIDEKPDDAKPADKKSDDVKIAEDKPTGQKPADAKAGDQETADAKVADQKPADTKAADQKPTETEAADQKPNDGKAENQKPDDAKAADQKTADAKVADQKPNDAKAANQKPDDAEATDQKTDDAKPVDQKPAKAADQKSNNVKPTHQKQDDAKPADQKPDVSKPTEVKPVGKKTPDEINVKKDDKKPEDAKLEDSKREDLKQDDVKLETPESSSKFESKTVDQNLPIESWSALQATSKEIEESIAHLKRVMNTAKPAQDKTGRNSMERQAFLGNLGYGGVAGLFDPMLIWTMLYQGVSQAGSQLVNAALSDPHFQAKLQAAKKQKQKVQQESPLRRESFAEDNELNLKFQDSIETVMSELGREISPKPTYGQNSVVLESKQGKAGAKGKKQSEPIASSTTRSRLDGDSNWGDSLLTTEEESEDSTISPKLPAFWFKH